MKILLITGSRYYSDYKEFTDCVLKKIQPKEIHTVVHGGATGTDYMAGQFAKDRDLPLRVFSANWEQYGKAAGAIRNKKMLDWCLEQPIPTVCLAFPARTSKGTRHMIELAKTKTELTIFAIETEESSHSHNPTHKELICEHCGNSVYILIPVIVGGPGDLHLMQNWCGGCIFS